MRRVGTAPGHTCQQKRKMITHHARVRAELTMPAETPMGRHGRGGRAVSDPPRDHEHGERAGAYVCVRTPSVCAARCTCGPHTAVAHVSGPRRACTPAGVHCCVHALCAGGHTDIAGHEPPSVSEEDECPPRMIGGQDGPVCHLRWHDLSRYAPGTDPPVLNRPWPPIPGPSPGICA